MFRHLSMNSSKMKILRHGLGSLVFLLIALGGILWFSYLSLPRHFDFNRNMILGFYDQKENELDVVSYGSSAMYRYLDTPYLWKKTGLTSYNFTTSANPVETIPFMMEETEKTQAPQLYIVECRMFVKYRIHDEAIRRVTDNIDASLTRLKLITKLVSDPTQWPDYIFRLGTYHDHLENTVDELLVCADPAEIMDYADNRATINKKNWTDIKTIKDIGELPVWEDAQPVALEDGASKAMEELLEDCRKHGRQVLFILTPYHREEEEAGRAVSLEQMIEEAGYEFLDLNQLYEELALDPSKDFYNADHANVYGAKKVTDYLAQYMQEKYGVSADHDETVIQEWDTYAAQFRTSGRG